MTRWQETQILTGHTLFSREEANGLRLFFVKDSTVPIFVYQSWFGVGSAAEREDPRLRKTGMAHFFEHLMFRGTQKIGDGQFDRVLVEQGAHDLNANTWFDRTCYHQTVPKESIETVFRLESDRLLNLNLSHDVFESERGAVLGELHLGLDDSDVVGYDHLYLNVFHHHPYRFGVIGIEKELKEMTLQDAQYFYETYYSPSNLTLFFLGDSSVDEIDQMVSKYYAPIPRKKIPDLILPEEKFEWPRTGRFDFQHEQLDHEAVFIGYLAPAVDHPDFAACWVLQTFIGDGISSQLQEIWVDSGMATEVESDLDAFKSPGILSFAVDLQEGTSPEKAIDRFNVMIRNLEFSETDLVRCRNALKLDIAKNWSNIEAIGAWMGEFIYSGGSLTFGFELFARIQAVSLPDVKRVLAQYVHSRNQVVVVGQPK